VREGPAPSITSGCVAGVHVRPLRGAARNPPTPGGVLGQGLARGPFGGPPSVGEGLRGGVGAGSLHVAGQQPLRQSAHGGWQAVRLEHSCGQVAIGHRVTVLAR
jgi:hypothetical protein